MIKQNEKFEKLFQSISKEWCEITKAESPITFKDFKQFIAGYTQGIDKTYPLENDLSSDLQPYLDILHFNVAYNHFYYENLLQHLTGGAIYASKEKSERNELTDLTILQLWRQKNFTLDNITRSFCIGREYQAFQQLRSYIEVCQLIFLLLTNFESLQKYMNHTLTAEEYEKLWWKHLKPSSISKKIKATKKEIKDEESKTGLTFFDIRKSEPGNNLDYFININNMCNDYIHWKNDALLYHSFDKSKNGFRTGFFIDWSNNSKKSLVNFIETVSYSTDWINGALSCHLTLFNRHKNEEDKIGGMLEFIQSQLALTAIVEADMYEFSKSQP